MMNPDNYLAIEFHHDRAAAGPLYSTRFTQISGYEQYSRILSHAVLEGLVK
jgi:hypothetical protein